MKLTLISLFILLLTYLGDTHAQDTIFFDDFESGYLTNWQHGSGWDVIEDEAGLILEGNGQVTASPNIASKVNIMIKAKIKILENGLHFNIGFPGGRYQIEIHEQDIQFHDIPFGHHDEVEFNKALDKWNNYGAFRQDSLFYFYVNDSIIFTYQDTNRIGWSSNVSFECLDRIQIDSVIITAKTENSTSTLTKKWIRTGGPLGGIGYDIRIDPIEPERIYVTDQWAGNHKSIDGGKNWYPNNTGISSIFGSTGQSVPIFCLTIDPINTNNLWCGTFNNLGVYRSDDFGESWKLKTNGIPQFDCGITFRGFAISPDNSDVVFCGVEIQSCTESASHGKIYKTTDGGENWREVLSSDALVRHILINPEHPDTMYASTGIFDRNCIKEEGVWKSTDGGENWFHVNNGLTDLTVGGLHMDPNNPEVLWAATGREDIFGGDMTGEIFVTRNGGISWEQVLPKGDENICYTVNSITTVGRSSDTIFAVSECGFYFSPDKGISWESGSYNMHGISHGIPVGIAAHPEKESTIMINSYTGGVFITEDFGKTWRSNSKGYTGAEIFDIVIDPDLATRIFASGRSGIAKTSNAGFSWVGAGHLAEGVTDIGAGPVGDFSRLEINPLNKNSILAGARWGPFLINSIDGLNWKVIFDFREIGTIWGHGIGDIAYSKQDSNNIFVGIRYTTLPLIIDRPYHYDPDIMSFGIAKSEDSGQSWDFVNNGLEETTKNVQAIEVHPDNSDVAFIGVYGFGIYKTDNGGQSWIQKSNGLTSYLIADISITQGNPNHIYAGAEDGGIFKSSDGGENWSPIMNGLDPEASVRSIVFHPGKSDTVYCSDWHTGVYITRNGGDMWYPLNEGLSQRSCQRLAISKDASILYAASQGGGVFRLPLIEFPPMVESLSHDSLSHITLNKGDSITLSVDAFDINDDSLSYSWNIRNLSDLENSLPSFKFHTDTLSLGDYEIELSISDTSSIVKVRWVVTIIEETINQIAINESQNSIRVFPNPIEENKLYFQYEMSEELLSYQVFNINGKLLVNKKYSKEKWVEFSNYKGGIYILKFIFKSKTEAHKVIKL